MIMYKNHFLKDINLLYLSKYVKDVNLPLETAEWVAKDREAWKRLTDGNDARILRGLCR